MPEAASVKILLSMPQLSANDIASDSLRLMSGITAPISMLKRVDTGSFFNVHVVLRKRASPSGIAAPSPMNAGREKP